MAEQIIRQRTASPARWQAALQRAFDEGVEVRQLSGSGAWIATSGTDAGIAYEVDQFGGCTCAAAMLGNDPVCKHLARLYFELGLLDFDPEPTPAVPAQVVKCQTCGDTGFVTKTNSIRPDLTYRAACRDCRKVVDIRPFLAAKYGGRKTA